jgi:hypothetical protein
MMTIKLGIKSSVPERPITQAEKVATSKGLQDTFFVSHVSSLETANGQFLRGQRGRQSTGKEGTIVRIQREQRGGSRRRTRRGNITSMKMTHGKSLGLIRVSSHVIEDCGEIVGGGETGRRDGIDGGNAREAVELQMEGVSARARRRPTTRSKNNGNTGGRRVKMTELFNGSKSIINRKDLIVTNGSDIREQKTFLELAKAVTTSRSQHGSDVGTGEGRTAIELEGAGMHKGRIKGHVKNVFIGERG